MRELGMLVSEQKLEKKIVSTQIRPHQILFVVNNKISNEQLVKLIQFNTHIWGGFYNAFIPTDGNIIKDDWWYLMQLADPDIVCLVGDVSENLIEEIIDKINPITIKKWDDKILDFLIKEGFLLDLRIVPIQNILYAQTKGTYIPDKSNILISSCDENYFLYPYIKSVFGHLSKNFVNWYKEGLKANTFNFEEQNLTKYLEGYQKTIDLMTSIKLTSMGLSVTLLDSMLNARNVFYIFGVGDKFIDDFCLYWYYRRYIHPDPLLLPLKYLLNDNELIKLKDWLNKVYPHKNIIDIFSASLNSETAKELGTKLEQNLGLERIYGIRFQNFDEIEVGRIIITEKNTLTEEMEFIDGKCRMKVRKPVSFERTQLTSWIIDVDIQGVIYRSDGYRLPKRSEFSVLFRDTRDRFPSYDYKISRGFSFSIPVFENDKFINLELKEPFVLIENLFQKYGYTLELVEVNKYCTGMLKLAGDLNFLKIFQDKNIRDLFKAMCRPSVVKRLNEIEGYLKYGEDHQKAKDFVTNLSKRNILLRGYNLRCPHCDLTQWYPLKEIGEFMTCAGCLSKFQLPAKLDFHYRLNDLFVRGIKDCGAIPVILTLIFLSNLSEESFLYLVGAKIRRKIETDIDLIAICDRAIIFCECKDLESEIDEKTIEKLREQFKNLYELSKEMGNEVVILSTLIEETNKKLIDDIKTAFPVSNRINVEFLFSADLQAGKRENIHSIRLLLPKPESPPAGAVSYLRFGKKTNEIERTLIV